MKTVCIYNEKGGAFKTTVSILLASYLTYRCGKKVCILDFDYPAYHLAKLRFREEVQLSDPTSVLKRYLERNPNTFEPYDIIDMEMGEDMLPDISIIKETVADINSKGYDYVIFDCPGRFTETEAVTVLAYNDFIDFMAVPITTDSQFVESALVICDAFKPLIKNMTVFWSNVTRSEFNDGDRRFALTTKYFRESKGIDVMEEKYRSCELMKMKNRGQSPMFILSTLCWPKAYIDIMCPWLEPFMAALIQRIDTTK